MPATPSPRTPRTSRHMKPYTRTPNTGSSTGLEEIMTPSPSPSTSSGGESEYVIPDEAKPSLSDEEFFAPSPSPSAGPKTDKTASASANRAKKSPKTGFSPKRAPSAWNAEQDWKMFCVLHPKVKIDWATVARATGRDAKSCQNRWAILRKKLEGAIKGISG